MLIFNCAIKKYIQNYPLVLGFVKMGSWEPLEIVIRLKTSEIALWQNFVIDN
jgi:hypothetical protein